MFGQKKGNSFANSSKYFGVFLFSKKTINYQDNYVTRTIFHHTVNFLICNHYTYTFFRFLFIDGDNGNYFVYICGNFSMFLIHNLKAKLHMAVVVFFQIYVIKVFFHYNLLLKLLFFTLLTNKFHFCIPNCLLKLVEFNFTVLLLNNVKMACYFFDSCFLCLFSRKKVLNNYKCQYQPYHPYGQYGQYLNSFSPFEWKVFFPNVEKTVVAVVVKVF